ncbi:hypothetical protein [Micromonospora auratinigra]|nr:hypothetical protein [Micromonospora auratinigra]
MTFVPPEHLAQTRIVGADKILAGEVDLRRYPHRHLAVQPRVSLFGGVQPATQLLAAVEHLSNYGWTLVNVTGIGEPPQVYAFMRRA